MTENRAEAVLRPWWDVAYTYSLYSLIVAAGILLLFSTSEHQNDQISVKVNQAEMPRSAELEQQRITTAVLAGLQAEEIARIRRNIGEEQPNDESTKRHSDQQSTTRSTQNGLNPAYPDVPITSINTTAISTATTTTSETTTPATADFNFLSTMQDTRGRFKRENNSKEHVKDIVTPEKLVAYSHVETIHSVLILGIFTCLFIFEAAFTRLFYSNQLAQTLSQVVETLSDIRQFRNLNQGLIFANTVHHSFDRRPLWILFGAHNIARLILTTLALIIVAYIHIENISRGINQGIYALAIVVAIMMLVQLGLVTFATFWPFLIKYSSWGKLMSNYSSSLDKIDIARGRCVPAPPFVTAVTPETSQRSQQSWQSPSRFSMSASVEYLASGLRDRQQGGFGQTERIVEAFNPYSTSPNIKLLLDLVASRSGTGMALRCLSYMELDVHNNWRPFRPILTFSCRQCRQVSTLEVTWCDPLAVLYLNPVPDDLKLHYGIEISFCKPSSGERSTLSNDPGDLRDPSIEIIGYKESRYFKHVHNKKDQHRQKASLKNVNTGSVPSDMDQVADGCFTYREMFPDVTPTDGPFTVTIWTIVDGQLIAKSTVRFDERAQSVTYPTTTAASTATMRTSIYGPGVNMVPKPPRVPQHLLSQQEVVVVENAVEILPQGGEERRKSENLNSDGAAMTKSPLTAEPKQEEGEIELQNISGQNKGDERVLWSKSCKPVWDDLEPMSLEHDNSELRASIILSETPSDSSLSCSEDDENNDSTQFKNENGGKNGAQKERKFGAKKLTKSSKTKSLTSLKLEGVTLNLGRRFKEYNVSGDKLNSAGSAHDLDRLKPRIRKPVGILRKAKSTGQNLMNHFIGVDLKQNQETSPYFQTVKPLMPKLSSSDEKVSKSAVAGDSALLETDKNLSVGYENVGFESEASCPKQVLPSGATLTSADIEDVNKTNIEDANKEDAKNKPAEDEYEEEIFII